MAKKLKEAGWSQKIPSQWYAKDKNWEIQSVLQRHSCRFHPTEGWHEHGCPHLELIAAPTIGELLEELPDGVSLWRGSGSKTWHAQTEDESLGVRLITTPADALAALWLALKEKNLV